jgi:hypothetical protein
MQSPGKATLQQIYLKAGYDQAGRFAECYDACDGNGQTGLIPMRSYVLGGAGLAFASD